MWPVSSADGSPCIPLILWLADILTASIPRRDPHFRRGGTSHSSRFSLASTSAVSSGSDSARRFVLAIAVADPTHPSRPSHPAMRCCTGRARPPDRDLRPTAQGESAEDALDVVRYRAGGEHQTPRDLFVGQSFGQAGRHLLLSAGQLGELLGDAATPASLRVGREPLHQLGGGSACRPKWRPRPGSRDRAR